MLKSTKVLEPAVWVRLETAVGADDRSAWQLTAVPGKAEAKRVAALAVTSLTSASRAS